MAGKILIVEDNSRFAEILAVLLNEAGYETSVVVFAHPTLIAWAFRGLCSDRFLFRSHTLSLTVRL